MNPFDAVYSHDAIDAARLAQAFISARNEDELRAMLRFEHALNGGRGYSLADYLDGSIFADWCVGQELCFDRMQDIAHDYRVTSTPGIWRLT